MNSDHVVSGKPQGSKLVVPRESCGYPSGVEDFITLRDSLGYIDKTQFIAPISQWKASLLCRPRRFGKTHTVGMLQYFHGVEYRLRYDKLFKVCVLGNQHFCRLFTADT